MFRSAREYNYASLCIYFKILHITLHISINNLIFKHSDAKIVTKILEAKGIEILIVNNGSLEKNSPLFILQFLCLRTPFFFAVLSLAELSQSRMQ